MTFFGSNAFDHTIIKTTEIKIILYQAGNKVITSYAWYRITGDMYN